MRCASTLAFPTVCLSITLIWVIPFNQLSSGFAVAGEYEDAKIKEAQEAAFEQMIQWLKSH